MNPVGHQGQIDGGVVQGVGYGLIEYLPVQDGRVEVAQLRRIQNPHSPRYSAAQNRHLAERQRRWAVQSQRHRRKSDLAGGAGDRQRHRRRGRRAHTRFAGHGGEGLCSAGTRPKCVSGFKSRAKLAFCRRLVTEHADSIPHDTPVAINILAPCATSSAAHLTDHSGHGFRVLR